MTQLPLPALVEPEIKLNYNMCMPKGTGVPASKSLLEGTIGNATYRGLPDYYDLLLSKVCSYVACRFEYGLNSS